MIQLGQLATKVGGEWHIDVAALPTTAGQVEAALHRDQQLRATVEDALDLGDRPGRRRDSVRDLPVADPGVVSGPRALWVTNAVTLSGEVTKLSF
jgi:hypothetical protein